MFYFTTFANWQYWYSYIYCLFFEMNVSNGISKTYCFYFTFVWFHIKIKSKTFRQHSWKNKAQVSIWEDTLGCISFDPISYVKSLYCVHCRKNIFNYGPLEKNNVYTKMVITLSFPFPHVYVTVHTIKVYIICHDKCISNYFDKKVKEIDFLDDFWKQMWQFLPIFRQTSRVPI